MASAGLCAVAGRDSRELDLVSQEAFPFRWVCLCPGLTSALLWSLVPGLVDGIRGWCLLASDLA